MHNGFGFLQNLETLIKIQKFLENFCCPINHSLYLIPSQDLRKSILKKHGKKIKALKNGEMRREETHIHPSQEGEGEGAEAEE